MATVIDALIVTLGLDGKAFAAGSKDALDRLKSTKEGSKRVNTEMTAEEEKAAKARGEIVRKEADAREAAGKKVALGLSQLRNQALALAAVFTAGLGIKNFVANTIANAAGLDRMSANLGMSAKDLAAWRLAAENAGGTAEGMAAQLRESNEQVAKFKIGGVTDETNTFLQYGGKATDLQDGNRYLLARADILQRLYATDPSQAALVGSKMGISEDQFNFLRQGSTGVQAAVKAQEGLASALGEAAAPAERLRKQFNTFENTLASVSVRVLTALLPSLERIVKKLQEMGDWFVANKESINEWVTSAVAGISKFVEWTDKAAKSVGGWQNILIALAGRKILSMVTPLLSLAGALTSIASSLGFIGGTTAATAVEVVSRLSLPAAAAAALLYSKDLNKGEPETLAAMNQPLTNSGTAQDTVRKLQAMGWSREQAIGIAANLKQESEFNHKASGDGGKAYGIAQWHPDRQEKFKAAYGIDIKDSTFDQQLAFVDLELRTNEKRAGEKLRGATTPQEAAKVVSTYYERPKETEAEELRRAGIAGAIYGAIYRSEQGAAATGNMVSAAQDPARGKVDWSAGRASTSTSETTIGQLIVNTQATDAHGIARGMAGALSENPLVSQANNGVN